MQQTTAIVPFNIQELATTVQSLPQVYEDAKMRAERAVSAGNSLIEQAKDGMNDELDEQMTEFIKKARTTGELINNNRTPGTQLFQAITKSFTALEGNIKTCIEGIEKQRNGYATLKAQEAKKREAEAARKAAIEKEKAEVSADIERQVRQAYVGYLATRKKNILSILESMTLSTVDEASRHIRGLDESLSQDTVKGFNVTAFPVHMDNVTLDAIKYSIITTLFPQMAPHYKTELSAAKREALDKIPSKISELKAMEQAGAAEKERLQQEADRRKKEEEDRLAQQAADESKKAQDEAEAKAQAGAMNAMFEATAAVGDASVPKGKEEYEIVVLHQQAYAEMFAMWFTKEGYKLPMDQLEKVTLKKVRNHFEDMAAKTGEKLESKSFRYETKFKTIVRR